MRNYFEASAASVASVESELARLSVQAESSREALQLRNDCRVLVPELFYDPSRVAFFNNLPRDQFDRCYFIVYDLLPFTHPQFFVANPPQEIINGYIRVLRSARNVAFISKRTRDTYYRRLLRNGSCNGPVFRLGSDGLGDRPVIPRSLSPHPKFTVVGTIEPRKNHALILDVFESLLRQMDGLRLVFLGRMGWVDSSLTERIQWMASGGCPGFEHHASPSDQLIRQHVLESWATVYISEAEGFGLPPVESLWLGTPVIASGAIPSLEAMGSTGVHIIEPIKACTVKAAVLAFLDESYVGRKTEEAASLKLSTWKNFAFEITEWCTA